MNETGGENMSEEEANRPSADQPDKSASAVAEYSFRTKPLRFGEEASITHHFSRECKLSGISHEPDVTLVRVVLGTRTEQLVDGTQKRTLEDALKAEPYRAPADSYLVIVVRNDKEGAPRFLDVSVHVTDETGPVVAVNPFMAKIMRVGGTREITKRPDSEIASAPESQTKTQKTQVPAQTKGPVPRKGVSSDITRSVQVEEGSYAIPLSLREARLIFGAIAQGMPLFPDVRLQLIGRMTTALEQDLRQVSVGGGQVILVSEAPVLARLYEAVRHHRAHQLSVSDPAVAEALREALKHAIQLENVGVGAPRQITPSAGAMHSSDGGLTPDDGRAG